MAQVFSLEPSLVDAPQAWGMCWGASGRWGTWACIRADTLPLVRPQKFPDTLGSLEGNTEGPGTTSSVHACVGMLSHFSHV